MHPYHEVPPRPVSPARCLGLLAFGVVLALGLPCTAAPGRAAAPPRPGSAPFRTIKVGTQPGLIVLDDQRHLAFVGNTGTEDSAGNFRQSSISVIDTRTQTVRATVPVTAALVTMVLDVRTGRLFFATGFVPIIGGAVSTLDVRTGRVIRTVPVGGDLPSLAVDEQHGHVFVTSPLSGTTVLDATDGQRLAAITPNVQLGQPRPTGEMVVDHHTARLFTVDQTAGWIGVLDLTAPPGPRMLVTLTSVGGGSSGPPVVDEATGHVFVFQSFAIHELDGRTGHDLGSVPLCPVLMHSASLAIAARTRRLFVGGVDYGDPVGMSGLIGVYTMDAPPASALLRCVTAHGGAGVFQDDPRHGVVVVLLTKDTVGLFDDRTGTPRRTVNVGKGYGVVVVDSQTGAAYLPYPDQGVIRVYPHGL